MHQNPKVVFPNQKQMVEYAIPSLVSKTMEQHVITTLDPMLQHVSNLWIYKFRHDTFAHVTMGLFETIDTIGVAMVTQVRIFCLFAIC
jgi:hypothetical protein